MIGATVARMSILHGRAQPIATNRSIASLHDNTGGEHGLKSAQTRRWAQPIAFGGALLYLPLLVPIILFISSLYIPPRMGFDSGVGFLVLRNMLEGGAFNSIPSPDPTNIANDVVTFVTGWSPGQYLVPGGFIWLGTNYGLAISLTVLIATLTGLLGWIQVARSFVVNSFVLFVFVLGLSTFLHVTYSFFAYTGGEVLLFAIAPWSFYAMRLAVNKPPTLCLAISLLSVALLFFAKLTGLIVFGTNVVAISLLTLVNQGRLSCSTITTWVASATALCLTMFWVACGPTGSLLSPAVPSSTSTFTFSWLPIWFSVTGAALAGTSSLDFLGWFLQHFGLSMIPNPLSYVLGPFVLLLMVWVWFRVRRTRYREMAVLLIIIILLYAMTFAAMWLRASTISFDDRHFRYPGILFFLLLLMAIDQSRVCLVKSLACVAVIVLGLYGLKGYARAAYAQMQAGYYDPMTGISQDVVSPAILEYLRSETTRHNVQRPIAVVTSSSAAISLPRFRIIFYRDAPTWAGRAEKIFVLVPEEMALDGGADTILRSLVDYDFGNWSQMELDGVVIYSQ